MIIDGQSIFPCLCMFCRSLFVLFVLFFLAIVLSVFLRYTDSDYSFGIFKLLFWLSRENLEKLTIIILEQICYYNQMTNRLCINSLNGKDILSVLVGNILLYMTYLLLFQWYCLKFLIFSLFLWEHVLIKSYILFWYLKTFNREVL